MDVTFWQLSSKFLRSNTVANATVSKESFEEAVCECTKLKYLWTKMTIWVDMLPAHLLSAVHYQTTRDQLTQTS